MDRASELTAFLSREQPYLLKKDRPGERMRWQSALSARDRPKRWARSVREAAVLPQLLKTRAECLHSLGPSAHDVQMPQGNLSRGNAVAVEKVAMSGRLGLLDALT